MCVQLDSLYACGHRSFKRFDNCPQFGMTCLGAGPNHTNVAVARDCDDCKVRRVARPAGESPDSGGGGSSGGEKDPWAEGDPWKKKRKR